MVVGACLALAWIPTRLLYGDEFHSLPLLGRPYAELLRSYGINGSSPALLLLQRLGLDLFGPTPWALRLPALLGALGSLLLIYPTGARLVGRAPAAIATLALALSPMHVFYSRFGRNYALMICLSLLFVLCLQRVEARRRPGLLDYLGVTLSAALLAYVHLVASAFVALVGGAAVASAALRPERRRQAGLLLVSLVAAAALAAALYFPAREPFLRFVTDKARSATHNLSILDVANLLAGGRVQAWIWLVGVPLSGLLVLKRRGARGVLLVSAAFAMLPALVAARPLGDSYAYARYLLPGLPFALMLLAWGIEAGLGALGLAGARLAYGVLAAGSLAVLTSWATGPLGPARAEDGPFGASYLRLHPLPAFDAPWPGASRFYEMLAHDDGATHIIEAPELKDQAIALYRNHYLRHHKQVSEGMVQSELPSSATTWVAPLSRAASTGADYLVLHLDVRREVSDYWRFVFLDQWNARFDPELAGFMAFHRALFVPPPPELSALLPRFEARYGAPVYRDDRVAVWRLRQR